jgi:hypothetical protein
MTIIAKNIGRINVWPTYGTAREADTEECKFIGQMTVWRTNEEARANISHEEEGGGGGAPDWVPANAVIHIDLVGGSPQGRAWVAGTGEVAVETLLGNDPNTFNAWGESNYDDDLLTPSFGYGTESTEGDDAPIVALIGNALTTTLGEFTCTIRVLDHRMDSPVDHVSLVLASMDGNDALELDVEGSALSVLGYSWGGSLDEEIGNITNNLNDALNCAALTVAGSRFEFAANGSTAEAGIVGETDRPPGNPFVTAFLLLKDGGQYLQSLTLYDPLPSTAGLSELSEV